MAAALDAVLHAPTDFLAGNGGRPPVDEESELRVAEPLDALLVLFGSFSELRGLGRGIGGNRAKQGGGGEQSGDGVMQIVMMGLIGMDYCSNPAGEDLEFVDVDRHWPPV